MSPAARQATSQTAIFHATLGFQQYKKCGSKHYAFQASVYLTQQQPKQPAV
jgi:hypothetical protein